jgi:uncharacterized membrane protein
VTDPQDPAEVTPAPPVAEQQVEQLVNVVLAKIEQRFEQHLHVPIYMPDVDELADMRERTPEAYEAWVRMTEQRSATENHMDRAEYDQPFQIAVRGQRYGVVALILVLAFCGYLASLGTAGTIVGGILATIDIVTLIAQLMGNKPEPKAAPGSEVEKK